MKRLAAGCALYLAVVVTSLTIFFFAAPVKAGALTDYLEQEVIKYWFQNSGTTAAKPTTTYVGLISANRGYFAASTGYSSGDYVLPTTPNGRLYKVTTAGTSAASEPTWPTTAGGTVTSGGAVFTEQTTALEAGTYPEPSGGSYARVSVTNNTTNWPGPTSGNATVSNNSAVTFPAPTANWGVIFGFVITDASTGGNALIYSALTTPKTVNSGDAAPSFSASALTVQIDN